MSKLNGGGVFAGAVTWLILAGITVNKTSCVQWRACDGGDLFLTAMVSISMLVPAYFVADFFSSVPKDPE